ncbi:hypothetical protein NDU88_004192 [Pleurodeles waltl]|uniref:Uncharacterized protein n=1 Tax=Pleurodeles waltl TaxID=8319 RepID=A0AAV7UFT6_PLEWA|nr:hypothetical protein NDU88_004192 [Pleurodeles waltl]
MSVLPGPPRSTLQMLEPHAGLCPSRCSRSASLDDPLSVKLAMNPGTCFAAVRQADVMPDRGTNEFFSRQSLAGC